MGGFFEEFGQSISAPFSGDWGNAWEQRDPLGDATGIRFTDPYGVDFTKDNIKQRIDAAQGKGQEDLRYKPPTLEKGAEQLMNQRINRAARGLDSYNEELGMNVDAGKSLLSGGKGDGLSQAISRKQMDQLSPDLSRNAVQRNILARDQQFANLSYAAQLDATKKTMANDLQNRFTAATAAQNSARAQIIGGLTKPLFQAVGTVVGGYFGGPAGAQAGSAAGYAGGSAIAGSAGKDTEVTNYGEATKSAGRGKYYY